MNLPKKVPCGILHDFPTWESKSHLYTFSGIQIEIHGFTLYLIRIKKDNQQILLILIILKFVVIEQILYGYLWNYIFI